MVNAVGKRCSHVRLVPEGHASMPHPNVGFEKGRTGNPTNGQPLRQVFLGYIDTVLGL